MRSENVLLAFWGAYLLFILLVLALSFIAFGMAGALMLKPVDRSAAGFLLGVVLGPLGLVIAWTMRANGLLEREAFEKRHRAALAPTPTGERPSWLPDEPSRRFK